MYVVVDDESSFQIPFSSFSVFKFFVHMFYGMDHKLFDPFEQHGSICSM